MSLASVGPIGPPSARLGKIEQVTVVCNASWGKDKSSIMCQAYRYYILEYYIWYIVCYIYSTGGAI